MWVRHVPLLQLVCCRSDWNTQKDTFAEEMKRCFCAGQKLRGQTRWNLNASPCCLGSEDMLAGVSHDCLVVYFPLGKRKASWPFVCLIAFACFWTGVLCETTGERPQEVTSIAGVLATRILLRLRKLYGISLTHLASVKSLAASEALQTYLCVE